MKMLEAELERVRSEIAKLRVEEALLVKMMAKMTGEESIPAKKRTRSPNIKPIVLDIMREKAWEGATALEVDEIVRDKINTVAKDTVRTILSRLKSEGALVYAGDKYYEKQFAPQDTGPFNNKNLRAV